MTSSSSCEANETELAGRGLSTTLLHKATLKTGLFWGKLLYNIRMRTGQALGIGNAGGRLERHLMEGRQTALWGFGIVSGPFSRCLIADFCECLCDGKG